MENRKLLLAEDNPLMVRMIKLYLTKAGFDVSVAGNGEEAMQLVLDEKPEIIVSDIMMPGTDGIAFRNKLLLDPELRVIPFVFLTALGKTDQKIAGLKLFVDDYIVKPFEMEEFVARIESILARREHYNDLIKYDNLTHLYNKKTFLEELDKEIKRVLRYGGKMSFAILDLDHFKKCNDTYGHQFGDYVLIKFSNMLVSKLRETDYAGRFGGEEFMIAMTETDKKNATRVTERLRKSLSELSFDKEGFVQTLSAGVLTVPDDGKTVAEIIEKADKAMYEAKNSGRNKIVVVGAESEENTPA